MDVNGSPTDSRRLKGALLCPKRLHCSKERRRVGLLDDQGVADCALAKANASPNDHSDSLEALIASQSVPYGPSVDVGQVKIEHNDAGHHAGVEFFKRCLTARGGDDVDVFCEQSSAASSRSSLSSSTRRSADSGRILHTVVAGVPPLVAIGGKGVSEHR